MIEDFLADTFPGITSHMLSKCTTADASPITNDFPLDEMFSLIDEARELNFQHCLALIDLSIEVKRQAAERKQLSESFTDPHPELIFGRRKDSWFSQLCIERIGVDHYQHTYVSSARFIEVDYHCISFIEYFLIIYLQSLDDPEYSSPWEVTSALNRAFLSSAELDYEVALRKKFRLPEPCIKNALSTMAHCDEVGPFDAEYHAPEEELDYRDEMQALEEITQVINTVSNPEYLMPRRIRLRVPSGPYRILSNAEKDTIDR